MYRSLPKRKDDKQGCQGIYAEKQTDGALRSFTQKDTPCVTLIDQDVTDNFGTLHVKFENSIDVKGIGGGRRGIAALKFAGVLLTFSRDGSALAAGPTCRSQSQPELSHRTQLSKHCTKSPYCKHAEKWLRPNLPNLA